MRKLVPALAVMLGFALACGDSDTPSTTPETPVIQVNPTPPPEAKPAEPPPEVKPAEPKEEKRTEKISTTVTIEAVRKGAIQNAGRQAIVDKAKGMGYTRVDDVDHGTPSCNASTCTATVTGIVTKMVKVDADGKVLEEKKL